MPDEKLDELFSRIQAGDRSALRSLFESEYLNVCRVIRRFVADGATVEDLAQEVFVRLWVKREQLHITSNLPAYLRRMAVNEALAYLRRRRTFSAEAWTPEVQAGQEDSAEERYLHGELQERVREAIDELPPRCRSVFQLSRQEELTYKEIADKLDISVKTVENQMGKALKFLRTRLKGYLQIFL